MEPDRFQQNSKLFVLSLICLLLCLTLLALALYILPFLLWNWSYHVPEKVIIFREWLKEDYGFRELTASWTVFFTLMVPALVFGFISQWSANYIEKKIYHLDEEQTERHEDLQESLSFGLKIFILILLVLIAVTLVEWLIIPTTTF